MSYVPETIRVRLSSSFLFRARCKHCKSGPTEYYRSKNNYYWRNHDIWKKGLASFKKICKRFSDDFYLTESPSDFWSIGLFGFSPSFKSYKPRYHKNKGLSGEYGSQYTEYLCCECGRTTWRFDDKATSKRPEISQRKSRQYYPKKFVF